MQCQSKVLFLSCAIALTCISAPRIRHALADPYPENTYPVKDDSFAQKITPPQRALPVDDYLIELAKAGNANFIADVTSISKEQIVQPFPATAIAKFYHWVPKFHLTILDMTQQQGMSFLAYDPSTFLFWKEPDAVQLASRWVKETETNPDQKLPTAVDLYTVMTNGKHVFTDDELDDLPKEGKVVDIPLRDLPMERKTEALSTIKQLFIKNEMYSRAWFSDAFWETATIRLITGNSTDKVLAFLQVLGRYHQISLSNSLSGLQASETISVEPVVGK